MIEIAGDLEQDVYESIETQDMLIEKMTRLKHYI